MQTTIYALSDPPTGRVRYVGKTVKPLSQRLSEHVSIAKSTRRPCHRTHWIASLPTHPLITELEVVTGPHSDAAEVERRWIAALRAAGCRLTNATDGGEGVPGHVHSEEARAKMRGRKRSPETIAKMVAALRGRKRSPEASAKQAAAMRGRVRTPEHCAAISRAKRGMTFTAEHRAALSAAHKGKPFSPEQRAKMIAGIRATWAARRAARERD